MILKYLIEEEIVLKNYLSSIFTSRMIKVLNNNENSYIVNDQVVKNYYVLKPNDILQVVIPTILSDHIVPVNKPLDILFEDNYLLILNKPNNIASIPTRMHYDKSLANFVMGYYKQKAYNFGIHFVNRLDFATSGIIMIAKNPYIADLMKTKIIQKKYILKVHGQLRGNGIIKTNIEKAEDSIIKRIATAGSKAITYYSVLETHEDYSIVEAILATGKTHQLRIHFKELGHPIIGDNLYNNDSGDLFLHSTELKFNHPISNEVINIKKKPNWL